MLTEEQKRAIISDKRRIVVSASAGSGKTSTMVRRVLEQIKKGVPAKHIVMLTFTENAAREMVVRLSDALIEEIRAAKGELRERLVAASDALPMLSCGTIHSYCFTLIMSHFELLGLSPLHAIVDEEGATALRHRALADVVKAWYEADGEGYLDFSARFGRKGDASLKESVLRFYNYLTTAEDREGFLHKAEEIAAAPLEDTEAAKQFLLYYTRRAESLAKRFAALRDEAMELGAPTVAARMTARINELTSTFSFGSVRDFFRAAESQTVRAPAVSREERERVADLWERYESVDSVWKSLKSNQKSQTAALGTYEQACDAYTKASAIVLKLIAFTRDFSAAYEVRKQEARALDFADLEKYALALLLRPEIRAELSSECILVDECQDINPVQDRIITLLSEGCDLFSVGDVKQSIYRFRLADPDIFLTAMERASLDPAHSDVILFDRNFRSSQAVINFVNAVFAPLMKREFGGVNYAEAPLIGQEDGDKGAVRCFFYQEETEKKEISSVYRLREDAGRSRLEEEFCVEAEWVRDRIKEVVGTKLYDAKKKTEFTVRYSDIAILSAKRSPRADQVISVLRRSHVPMNLGKFQREGKCLEGEQLTDFLRLLLSPHDDFALLSVMRSPMFAFGTDEIARIALEEGKEYYKRALAYAQKPEGGKVRALLDYLEKARFDSSVLSLPDLMRKVVEEKFRLALLKETDGRLRLGKLMKFVDTVCARKEIDSVAAFLEYHDEFYAGAPAGEITDGNAVNVMTVHESKGLEFPIVFLIDTGRNILSNREARDNVVADKDLGLHKKVAEEEGNRVRDNLAFKGTVMKKNRESMEDALRLLYVALTRAKNRLYVSGKISDKRYGTLLAPEFAATTAEWIAYAMRNVGGIERYYEPARIMEAAPTVSQTESAFDASALRRAFAYEYPHKKATVTGIKYTVTGINTMDDEGYYPPTPLFPEEKTERGTALHAVMENIPLDVDSEEAVASCLAAFTENGVISEEEAKAVRASTVLSAVRKVRALVGERKVEREKTFMLKVPAREVGVADLEDEVAVQGKVDLMAVGEDAIVVDYKLTGAPADVLRERYRAQLALYALAVRKSLHVVNVRTYIFVLGRNELIEI